jgi:hypothetical protein
MPSVNNGVGPRKLRVTVTVEEFVPQNPLKYQVQKSSGQAQEVSLRSRSSTTVLKIFDGSFVGYFELSSWAAKCLVTIFLAPHPGYGCSVEV